MAQPQRSCLAKGDAGAREGRRVSIATDMNSTLLISPCLSKSEARELFFADPSSMEYEEAASPERAQFVPADVYAARAAELDAARAAACKSAIAAARRAADRSLARSKLLAQQDAAADGENTPPQRSPVASPPAKLPEQQKAAVASPLSMRAVLAAEPLTRAQREERDIEALSVDELKQRIVATARRRRERRAQLQVAEAYVY